MVVLDGGVESGCGQADEDRETGAGAWALCEEAREVALARSLRMPGLSGVPPRCRHSKGGNDRPEVLFLLLYVQGSMGTKR